MQVPQQKQWDVSVATGCPLGLDVDSGLSGYHGPDKQVILLGFWGVRGRAKTQDSTNPNPHRQLLTGAARLSGGCGRPRSQGGTAGPSSSAAPVPPTGRPPPLDPPLGGRSPCKRLIEPQELAEIEEWIATVDDPHIRDIIRYRYIDGFFLATGRP